MTPGMRGPPPEVTTRSGTTPCCRIPRTRTSWHSGGSTAVCEWLDTEGVVGGGGGGGGGGGRKGSSGEGVVVLYDETGNRQ